MARRDESRPERGWETEGRGSRTEEERGRWSRERGDQGRMEYDRPGAWQRGGYERERMGPRGADWREPRDDSEWSEYRRPPDREGEWYGGERDRDERHRGEGYGYRGESYGGHGDGGYTGYRGRDPRSYRPSRPAEDETYGATQRWERMPIGSSDYGSGGAYAGGAYGGGAYGPGGFGGGAGGVGSPGFWPGAAGSGHAPSWAREMERGRGRDYSGRGPKGYRRSNERITEDVCDALTRHPDIDASDIGVRCENGEVILSGSVQDRWEKRLAEDTAERVAGVSEVRNEIRVQRRSEDLDTGAGRG